MTQRIETVKAEGLTVALLVWALLRRQPPGLVERILDINPGLADLGPILPVGTKIVIPMDEIDLTRTVAPAVVRLWD